MRKTEKIDLLYDVAAAIIMSVEPMHEKEIVRAHV